jgi:hypothetical protein
MGWFRRHDRGEPMPSRFHELAAYNTRVSQSIVHTPETVERMRLLQADFNEWQRQQWHRERAIVLDEPPLERTRQGIWESTPTRAELDAATDLTEGE